MGERAGLEVFRWEGEGYQPLVFFQDWQVALLNWEPVFDLHHLGEIERHNDTDEVFVLLRGSALLFTLMEDGQMQAEDMQLGVLYNVPAGVWHNLLSSRDAAWVIVEKRDTHVNDVEFRQLTQEEKVRLHLCIPKWLEKSSNG